MTPIGSTSSNIRRAIGFIVYSSCCRPGAPCGHSRSPGRLRAAKLTAQRRLTVHLKAAVMGLPEGTETMPTLIVGCAITGIGAFA
jgi:hypothetical protein